MSTRRVVSRPSSEESGNTQKNIIGLHVYHNVDLRKYMQLFTCLIAANFGLDFLRVCLFLVDFEMFLPRFMLFI